MEEYEEKGRKTRMRSHQKKVDGRRQFLLLLCGREWSEEERKLRVLQYCNDDDIHWFITPITTTTTTIGEEEKQVAAGIVVATKALCYLSL